MRKETLRDIWDDEEFAVYAMRLVGVIGPTELPSEQDLAVAVSLTRDELILENALEALEKHYGGATESSPCAVAFEGKLPAGNFVWWRPGGGDYEAAIEQSRWERRQAKTVCKAEQNG
jgi:hypothetical protein